MTSCGQHQPRKATTVVFSPQENPETAELTGHTPCYCSLPQSPQQLMGAAHQPEADFRAVGRYQQFLYHSSCQIKGLSQPLG